MRELYWAHEGADRQAWLYTAAITASAAGCAGSKDTDLKKHHPYLATEVHKNLKNQLLKLREEREKNA